jgi:hypothetical protein
MGEPTLLDRARTVGSAMVTGAAVFGVVVASSLDDGIGVGQAVGDALAVLVLAVAPMAAIGFALWVMAPGDLRLSRADRFRVNETIRLGVAIDDPRLASAVVRRADKVEQSLERTRNRLEGGLCHLVVVLLAAWAVSRVFADDLWLAGAAVVLAVVIARQRPYWAAARDRQRDRALAAGVAAIKLLMPTP